MTKRKRRHLWEAFFENAKRNKVPRESWPKPPDVFFERMSTDLKQTVDTAVMSVTEQARTDAWVWDPYEQKFTFTLCAWMKVSGHPVDIQTRLWFDPKVAWLDEVERVMAAAEEFVRTLRTKLKSKDDD